MADDDALHVPAQTIPVPTSLSPQARGFLTAAAQRIAAQQKSSAPPPSQAQQAEFAMQMMRPAAARFTGAFETIDLLHGAKLYRATPEGRAGRKAEVGYFDIHGGAFVAGGGEMCQLLTKMRALDLGIEVLSIDYRLAPEHKFPAALDDCMAAYREVLKRFQPSDLVVAGASAGGNLATAMLLRSRAEKLPMPAGLVLMTPGLDMTRAGDTYLTNRYLDVTLYGGATDGPNAYAGDHDLTDPYLSPLFGDVSGFPPTILTSGTRDLLLSDTVRMHRLLRRAGIAAELHVTEAGPHGGFMGSAPEDHETIGECRRFVYERLGIS